MNKSKKEEIVPKDFDSVHSAVNAKLKTSNNKHLNDLILNSPRIRLSRSENIILDNRDTKESIVNFVCVSKRKNTDFPDIYFTILEATQFPSKLVMNKNAKAKDRGTWISFNIWKRLNRMYTRGRAAYGSVRNLSKANGLSKKSKTIFTNRDIIYKNWASNHTFPKASSFFKIYE